MTIFSYLVILPEGTVVFQFVDIYAYVETSYEIDVEQNHWWHFTSIFISTA